MASEMTISCIFALIGGRASFHLAIRQPMSETEKLRQGTQIATESLFADQTWVQKEMDDKMIVNARLKKECPKLETRQRTGDSYLS